MKTKNWISTLLLFLVSFIVLLSCSSDNPTESDAKEIYWSKSDSPILIEGCYVVPENTTLTIEAGTEIRFRAKYSKDKQYDLMNTGMMVVQGKIIAEGTEQDSIVFTRDDSVENWGAIVFEATSDPNSILQYCKIQYSTEVEDYKYTILGAITFMAYSSGTVINCNISSNYVGIQCNGYANPDIKYSSIFDNGRGIYSYRCYSIIDNCKIYNNGNGIYGYNTYITINNCEIRDNIPSSGIYIENQSYPEITNNIIERNGYSGINCYDNSSPNIINNIIVGNEERGVVTNYYCKPNIVNNLISGSIRGVHIANYSDPFIINNTITNNNYAFRFFGYSSPYIINSIICNNDTIIDPLNDTFYSYNSTPILFSSLIQGDSLHYSVIDQGDNILGVDPMFVNDSLDFTLQSNSPCINKGFSDITELPENDISGNSRIVGSSIDIGAYEFQGSR